MLIACLRWVASTMRSPPADGIIGKPLIPDAKYYRDEGKSSDNGRQMASAARVPAKLDDVISVDDGMMRKLLALMACEIKWRLAKSSASIYRYHFFAPGAAENGQEQMKRHRLEAAFHQSMTRFQHRLPSLPKS